jgi:hypothetical protein
MFVGFESGWLCGHETSPDRYCLSAGISVLVCRC